MPVIKLEIADTPELLAKGLMFRTSLPADSGMLFKLPSPLHASFWGMNTYIPLDIAFVNNDGKIVDTKDICPLSTRTIRSTHPCSQAIELNAGFLKQHGLKIGDKVVISLDNKTAEFIKSD